MTTSPHDYPHDIELGLEPEPDDADALTTLRCGCAVRHWQAHDIGDCLEALADAAAELEDDLAAFEAESLAARQALP